MGVERETANEDWKKELCETNPNSQEGTLPKGFRRGMIRVKGVRDRGDDLTDAEKEASALATPAA